MHSSTFFTAAILLSAALINAYDPVKMLCLVNQQRSRSGLSPLGMSTQLENAAKEHSDDQAGMRSMTHDGSDGSSPGDRVERSGYDWRSVAENVAYGYGDEEECMQEWMNSPGHRENILGQDYTHFGSAVGYAGSTPYYTQDFGGDGKNHNFPECPSGGSYGEDSDYNGGGSDNYNGGGADDYNGDRSPSKDYNGGGSDNYNGGDVDDYNGDRSPSKNYNGGDVDDYSGDRSPSKNYSGGSAPSSGHRHRSGRKPAPKKTYRKPAPKKTYRKKTAKAYGAKLPSSRSKPKSYGGKKPSHKSKPKAKAYGKKPTTKAYGSKPRSGKQGAY
jgi:hypothetical protein